MENVGPCEPLPYLGGTLRYYGLVSPRAEAAGLDTFPKRIFKTILHYGLKPMIHAQSLSAFSVISSEVPYVFKKANALEIPNI